MHIIILCHSSKAYLNVLARERSKVFECWHTDDKHICLQSQPQDHPSVGVVMANSLKSQCFQPHISKNTMFLVLPQLQFGGVLLSLLFKKEQLFFAAALIWLLDHSCPEAGLLSGGLHLWEFRNLHASSVLPKI